jgi:hypothetical protein
VQEVLTLVEEDLLLVLLLDLEVLLLLDSVDDQVLGAVTGVVLLSVVQTEELVIGVDFDSVVFLLSVDQTEVVGVVFDSVFLVVVSTQTLLVDEEEAPQPAEEEVVLTSLMLELLSDAQGRATAKLPIVSSMCIATPIKSHTWKQAMRQLQPEC